MCFLIGIVLLSLVNVWLSGYSLLNALSEIRLLASGFIILFATVHFVKTADDVRRVLNLLFFMISFVVYLGFLEYLKNGSGVRLKGLAGQENQFGAFLAQVVPLLIGLWYCAPSVTRRRILLAVVMIGGIFLTLMTQSRGSWLALAVAIACLGFWYRKRIVVYAVVGLLLAPVIIPTSVTERARTLYAEDNDEYVLTAPNSRLEIWKASTPLIAQYGLFGAGYGMFEEKLEPIFGDARDAHNMYLQVLVELGIPGFVAFAWLFVSIIMVVVRTSEYDDDPMMRMLRRVVAATTLAVLIVNIFGTRLADLPTNGYYWITVGLLWKYFALLKNSNQGTEIAASASSSVGSTQARRCRRQYFPNSQHSRSYAHEPMTPGVAGPAS